MAKHLWSFMTPWLREEVGLIAQATHKGAFERWPYIGLHIRRGDKVSTREAAFHGAEVNHIWVLRLCEDRIDDDGTPRCLRSVI